MDLRTTQLKDTYGNLVTTGTTAGSPTEGGLQNGQGTLLTSVGIGTNSPSAVGSRTTLNISGSAGSAIRLSDDTSNAFLDYTDGSGVRLSVNASEPLTFRTTSQDRMTIDSSGNVGIGETNPSNKLEVNSGSTQTVSIFKASSTSTATNNGGALIGIRNTNNTNGNMEGLFFQNSNGVGTSGIIGYNVNHTTGEGLMTFGVRNSSGTFGEKMRIDSSGNVQLASSEQAIQWASGNGIVQAPTNLYIRTSGAGGNLLFQVNNDEKMRIDSSGNVGINKTAEDFAQLEVKADTNGKGALLLDSNGLNEPSYIIHEVNSSAGWEHGMLGSSSSYSYAFSYGDINTVGNHKVTITNGGNLTIVGALSKGSGSFKIDHPLESKKDTHHLVHSFVESPQANNIYRGSVDLVDGQATVNLDEVSGMTEGTFVLLNTDIHVYTSNESDWDAVKGSVSDNVLTIECQNPSSTAKVNWLVIGERHDQHMLDTDWTDENGKVIVEPLKPIEE